MGALRACYVTPARAYIGGPEVSIRWYFADAGAPFYRKGHVWSPVQYDEEKAPLTDVVGEIPYRRRPFYNGDNPDVTIEPESCGSEKDFLGEGTVPRLPNGQLDFTRFCKCAIKPCIGWKVLTKPLLHFTGELCAEVLFTELTPEARRYVGELAAEGEWNEQPQTGGWYFAVSGGTTYTNPTADHVCFFAEDSVNCGGSNDQRQTGHARKHFTFAVPTSITFALTGRVERQDTDFDRLRIEVDGVEVYNRGGTGEELGCAMADISDTVAVAVSPGPHQVDVFFDTVDERFHVGCFWCADLTFPPATMGEVCVEAIFTEYDTRDDHWGATLCVEAVQNEGDQPEGSWVAEVAQEDEVTEYP